VPTWNYIAVHAYGTARPLGPEATRALLDELSARHEGALAPKPPWTLAKLPPERIDQLVRAILAFELPIEQLEGKAKLSQNRTAADVAGAADALDRLGTEEAMSLARLMTAAKARADGR
jgi:transcriptional regulator